jgi:hypothetical protein
VHGLVAGFGRAAVHVTREALVARVPGLTAEQLRFAALPAGATVAVIDPGLADRASAMTWTPRGVLGLALSGYLLVGDTGQVSDHQANFLAAVEAHGLAPALREVVSGSFVLATIDLERGEVTIANDRMGSVAAFYVEVPGGALVTTIPSLLRLGNLVPAERDWTAVAELVYIGYTLSRRYMLVGARHMPPASLLRWDPHGERLALHETDLDPLRIDPSSRAPDVDELGDKIEAACRRLATIGGRTAHLLSGGMDSRLLLAAWPRDAELPCFSYGPAEFADVAVARVVAAIRGSRFTHVPLPPDEVAATFDDMSCYAGPPTFPNRYLTARRMRLEGFDNVVDGYLGDVFLGGTYYRSASDRSIFARVAGKLGWLVDASVDRVGLDTLAEGLFDGLVDPASDAWASRYFRPEVMSLLKGRKDEIRQDIREELQRLAPFHDSIALLLRDFWVANRSRHCIAQQGALCRRFLRTYYPLTNDVALANALARLRPRDVAYRRLQIRLFRRRYPAYAAAPYAASLLPIERHFLLHHWAPGLWRCHLRFPWLHPALAGTVPSYDEWNAWLQGSVALRDRTVDLLMATGMADSATLVARMDAVARGHERGVGELVHLASLGPILVNGSVAVRREA